jgi:hypothetical protein
MKEEKKGRIEEGLWFVQLDAVDANSLQLVINNGCLSYGGNRETSMGCFV